MKFLVIDDSSAMRKMIIRTLKQAGYSDHDFKEAEDGKEGLSFIDSWKPDMVLSDWHMPVMTGIEMAEELHDANSEVKLGLITTERAKENVRRAAEAGVLFVVQKPFTVESLQEALIPVLSDDFDPHEMQVVKDEKPPPFVLPNLPQVQTILDKLLSVKIEVNGSNPQEFNSLPLMAGLYAGKDRVTKAITIADINAACALGASLTIIPPSEVFKGLRTREIPSAIFDNVREIYNVLSAPFYLDEVKQEARLTAAHIIKKPNDKLKTLMSNPDTQRLDIEIQSDEYGKGFISILVVN